MGRQLEVHVQVYDGIDVPDLSYQGMDINSFFPADFRVRLLRVPGQVASGDEGGVGTVSMRQLQSDFLRYKQGVDAALAPDTWFAHVFLAGYLSGHANAYGVMYDAGEQLGHQREGCALFVSRIAETDTSGKLLLRTLAHELGHVLNLDHSDDDGDTEIMMDPCPSPEELGHSFSALSVHHLLMHPEVEVRPGRSDFGFTIYDPDSRFRHRARSGAEEGGLFSQAASALSVEVLGARRTAPVPVHLGEPLRVRTRLRNPSRTRPLRVSRGSAGGVRVRFELSRHPRAWERLVPPLYACTGESVSLLPGESVAQEHVLAFRRGRPVFAEPGSYQLRAVVRGADGNLVSDPVRLRVLPQRALPAEQALLALDPEVGRALEVGVDAGSPQAAKLHHIAGTFPDDHPLKQCCQQTLARAQEGRRPSHAHKR